MLHHVFKYLISKGHHCRVILHRDLDIATPYEWEGVEVFGSKPGTRADTYRWADVIITHLDFTQFTIIMAREARRPLVHFVHNDIPYSSIVNNFGGVSAVYNSEWIKEKIGYTIPGFVLHPPCDVAFYDTGATIKELFDREYITLISLNERKGGHFFYQIAKEMPDKKFMGVIGSYDNPGPLKKMQVDIINELVQLPNFTLVANTPDIISSYKKTRVLLMPSDYESWGRTATEAMCSGIPVICTPTPGLKENCKDAGVYIGSLIEDCKPGDAQVELGDLEDWVKAIRKFDDFKYYEKYSLLCKARAKELDPLKELEALENFLHDRKFDYRL
jgi:glycosyltransferase involved in cell wall biosynthesis